MPIGLIIKIQGKSFVVHKKYLFKEKKVFKKGEYFIAKYLGIDENGYPIWETKLNQSMDTEWIIIKTVFEHVIHTCKKEQGQVIK